MFQVSSFKFQVKKFQEKAFTLLELLIVIGIITIVSAIVFAGAGNKNQQFALQRSIYKLDQDMRRASEMGMSAKEFQGSVPDGGYGIYFNTAETTTSYILFADCDNNKVYTETGTPCNGFPEEVEKIDLEKKVYIKSLDPYSAINITFKPPNPTITISNADGTATTSEATTTIALEADPDSVRTIHFNRVGLIDIN